jgi:predicted Zn-dependent protease
VRAVRPLRIDIVSAKAGEDADALAGQMAIPDRRLDVFLLINGLEQHARLETGERYKIVTE